MHDVNLFWIVTYVALGLASVEFVRCAGPRAIGTSYRIEELYDDDESGKLNVAYRIVAPTICCELPVFAMTVACDALSVPGPTLRFLPIVFYWVFLGVKKQTGHALLDRLIPFLSEGIISLLLSLAFDHFVVGGYLGNQGIGVLDNSSIAFQFELALFGVATCWISTFFTRSRARRVRTYSNLKPVQSAPCYSPIDTSEAKLFAYEREYGSLLPRRFSSDVLLRTVFFTIMAIEDGNRPDFIRSVERMAARFNLAKTTGIMQQMSDKPLSDVDSVKLSIPYIERMWGQYLVEFARSIEGVGGEAFRIYPSYYTYDYEALSQSLCKHFGPFYGDYCGTRTLNASGVFREVLEFEERQHYCLLPDRISAIGSICASESTWLAGDYCFWSDHETIVSCLANSALSITKLVNSGDAGKESLEKVGVGLRRIGVAILSIKMVEGVAVELLCDGGAALICSVVGDEWEISC